MNPAFIEDDPEDDLVGDANTFTAQQRMAQRANLWSKGQQNPSRSNTGSLQGKQGITDFLQDISMDALLDDTQSIIKQLERDLLAAIKERQALKEQKLRTGAEIAMISLEIADHEGSIEKLNQGKARLPGKFAKDSARFGYQDGSEIRTELEKIREENKHKFGVDENGDPKADPQDEVLRQEACEANRDDLHDQYAKKGLSAEFEILERHRNGEYVDPAELKNAQEIVLEKRLSADLDVALYRNDRNNAFFKTETGLQIRLKNNEEILVLADRRLKKTETSLQSQIKRLEELREKRSELKVGEKETDKKLQELDDLISKKKEQLKRATELETKLQNPAFKAAFNRGEVDKKEMAALHSEYSSLQDDVRETNMAYHIGNPYDLSAVMPGKPSYHPRTPLSAAGPIGAMADKDGVSHNAFLESSALGGNRLPLLGTQHPEKRTVAFVQPSAM